MRGFILYYGFQHYGFLGISSVLLRSSKETSGQYYYGTIRGYIHGRSAKMSQFWVYHSEVSIQNSPRLFYIIGYVFQSCNAQYSEILNYRSSLCMLSIIRVFFIFGILVCSWRNIVYAVSVILLQILYQG